MTTASSQVKFCAAISVQPVFSLPDEKLGIVLSTLCQLPICGLRHDPESGTCGEELRQYPDFLEPLHVSHIRQYLPQIEKFLVLPPGYRFLVAESIEDIWHDQSIAGM